VVAVLALVGSAGLAAVAGVLTTVQAGAASAGDAGLGLSALAIGVALLGGTSAYGRRGGLLGVVLAAALITLVTRYATVTGRHASTYAVAAAAILLGLVVTRLVEAAGRPRNPVDGDTPLADSPTGQIDDESPDAKAWSTTPAWVGGSGRSLDSAWSAEKRWSDQ
jgi:hypothetical protein